MLWRRLPVDLVAPIERSAPRSLATANGRATLEVTLPQSPRLGLQLVATRGPSHFKSGVFDRRSLADADRDGDDLSDQDELALGTDLWEPDTDGDGFTDGYEHPHYTDPLDPLSTPAEYCGGHGDEDLDGLSDCADPDCVGLPPCIEVCTGGRDEDVDGLRDCADADCAGQAPCVEVCTGRRDEDLDGLRDCADPDCVGQPPCIEDCTGFRDEDLDGLVDCFDPDCAWLGGCVELCWGGIDEDSDGLMDCEDDDCSMSDRCVELDCADGADSDYDGLIDCEDDDCWGVTCNRKVLEIRQGEVTQLASHTRTASDAYCHLNYPIHCTYFAGTSTNSRTVSLTNASGRLATYSPSGAMLGSCEWQAPSLTNTMVSHFEFGGSGGGGWFAPGFIYAQDSQPVQFGPGCANPTREDVLAPTVYGPGGPALLWQRSWRQFQWYGIGDSGVGPRVPWGSGDHVGTQQTTASGSSTHDVWTNLRTPTPLERHVAP